MHTRITTNELQAGDIVRLSEIGEPFLDAVVTRIEDKGNGYRLAWVFRPWLSAEAYPKIGVEVFPIYCGDSPILRLRKAGE